MSMVEKDYTRTVQQFAQLEIQLVYSYTYSVWMRREKKEQCQLHCLRHSRTRLTERKERRVGKLTQPEEYIAELPNSRRHKLDHILAF